VYGEAAKVASDPPSPELLSDGKSCPRSAKAIQHQITGAAAHTDDAL
jgi:hypothetical protein